MSINSISRNPEGFLHAFNTETINCDAQGNFYKENLIVRIFRWLFTSLEDARLANIFNVFNNVVFSNIEKELLSSALYQPVRLTPTVLRSQQAGALLLGIVRSIV